MKAEKYLDKGIHSLTELIYNFLIGYPMSTQFSLELEYAHIHTTSPNQKKQIINKFQKVLFLGEVL